MFVCRLRQAAESTPSEKSDHDAGHERIAEDGPALAEGEPLLDEHVSGGAGWVGHLRRSD
jgi:hypothetical protein